MAYIPFQNLTDTQVDALQQVVSDRRVHDLGAGDLTYAFDLVHMGATHVVAIDKDPVQGYIDPHITFKHQWFEHVEDEGIDVAFMSWPSNYHNRIEVPAARAQTLVYIGKNTDGTVCGSAALFDLLLHRRLVTYIPDRRNVLLICRGVLGVPRAPTGDEYAGTHLERLWSYQGAEEAAASV